MRIRKMWPRKIRRRMIRRIRKQERHKLTYEFIRIVLRVGKCR